jgi:CRISPR-associated RAMP protein (TIGR02581 family)
MATSTSTDPHVSQNRYMLRNRYVFKGRLVMQTALHIGGGRVTLSSSDSPVVLTPEQKPYIPGSSFKGALRSTVEKIVPGLPGFSSCALIDLHLSAEEQKALSRDRERRKTICPTIRQGEIAQRRRDNPDQVAAIQNETLEELCDTCRLFGSPFAAARLNVNDLYMPKEEWSGIVQVRDGVAIDRDTEKARDRLKYDFEVVPASATFDLEIVLENATKRDVQLLCAGLSEFAHGFGVVGGKRSRGLGVAQLDGLVVSALELFNEGVDEKTVDEGERRRRLQQYLVSKQFSRVDVPGAEFLREYIDSIF